MGNFDANFQPYTKNEMVEGGNLPEIISSITHIVEVGEGLRLDLILNKIVKFHALSIEERVSALQF